MASRGINKVILIGYLGQDPDVRYMQNGSAVANINLATSETWRDKQTGEQNERTEWHRVVFIGKLAEVVGEYLKKGSQVYVEGKLQSRKWQDQSGQERYTTEVRVDGFGGVMQMLGQHSSNGEPQQGKWERSPVVMRGQATQPPQQPVQNSAWEKEFWAPMSSPPAYDENLNDDDPPF